jgi:hypothetical protein
MCLWNSFRRQESETAFQPRDQQCRFASAALRRGSRASSRALDVTNPEEVLMASQIPTRNTSKYAGQYACAFDSQRIVEIFADSYKIALSSKNPDTAGDRFALAVEAYHQLMSMEPSADVCGSVQQAMENLVELFPAQVVANEALGLREKARKLKTPRKQLELLHRARTIVDSGLTEHPSSSVLQAAAAELRAELSQSEASVT